MTELLSSRGRRELVATLDEVLCVWSTRYEEWRRKHHALEQAMRYAAMELGRSTCEQEIAVWESVLTRLSERIDEAEDRWHEAELMRDSTREIWLPHWERVRAEDYVANREAGIRAMHGKNAAYDARDDDWPYGLDIADMYAPTGEEE